jgi:hypothetical protein
MRGTLGKPKTDIDKLALGGTVLKSLGNLPIGGEAGKVIQGLNSILGGPQATNAPAQRSTPPPTTKSNNLIQSLGGLLTAPPTNAPAARGTNPPSTNQSPVDNLLNDLLKPKKKQATSSGKAARTE